MWKPAGLLNDSTELKEMETTSSTAGENVCRSYSSRHTQKDKKHWVFWVIAFMRWRQMYDSKALPSSFSNDSQNHEFNRCTTLLLSKVIWEPRTPVYVALILAGFSASHLHANHKWLSRRGIKRMQKSRLSLFPRGHKRNVCRLKNILCENK